MGRRSRNKRNELFLVEQFITEFFNTVLGNRGQSFLRYLRSIEADFYFPVLYLDGIHALHAADKAPEGEGALRRTALSGRSKYYFAHAGFFSYSSDGSITLPAGRKMSTLVPFPTALVITTVPFIMVIIFFTITRPRPVPVDLDV